VPHTKPAEHRLDFPEEPKRFSRETQKAGETPETTHAEQADANDTTAKEYEHYTHKEETRGSNTSQP
jgi:hypothetical protein